MILAVTASPRSRGAHRAISGISAVGQALGIEQTVVAQAVERRSASAPPRERSSITATMASNGASPSTSSAAWPNLAHQGRANRIESVVEGRHGDGSSRVARSVLPGMNPVQGARCPGLTSAAERSQPVGPPALTPAAISRQPHCRHAPACSCGGPPCWDAARGVHRPCRSWTRPP